MAIDIYSTRELNRFLEERLAPKRFFRNRLFRTELPHAAENIDVDLRRGTRAVARFVNPANAAGAVTRDGFTTISLTPPNLKEQMVLTAADLKKRLPGEDMYSGMSPDERASFWLGKDTTQLEDLMIRREELMCRDLLFTGKITISGDGITPYDIDYGFSNVVDLTSDEGAAPWGDAAANIRKNFMDWRAVVNGKCGATLNTGVLGGDAAEELFSDEAILKALDNRRSEIGFQRFEADPVEGSIYHGNLFGIDLYTYDELYKDPADGVVKNMIPAKQAVFCDSRVPMAMHYGCVTFFNKDGSAESYAQSRVGRSWNIEDPSARIFLMESRPLPDPVQVDSYLVATVLE
jgi:hypothetical protein